jgi:rhodanese-related sulfurtransferase
MFNLVNSGNACSALRRGGFHPYVRLGATADAQLADGVRFIALRRGEQFTTPLPNQQASVLQGRVLVPSGEPPLTPASTRAMPHALGGAGGGLVAETDSLVAVADSDFLDLVVSWDELARDAGEVGGLAGERMSRLQHAAPFRRLPLECVLAALERMTPRRVVAGEEIFRQGDPGDAFYTIWEGKAEVWQTGPYDDLPQLVAVREAGEAFGDEALVTGGTRNATVRMASDGQLLVLARADFLALISQPLIQEVDAAVAKSMLDARWLALDVRYPEEFEDGHIPGAKLLPLGELRERCNAELSPEQGYVVVCLSGKRSAVGALLLAQRGFRAVTLKDGLREWAFGIESGAGGAPA